MGSTATVVSLKLEIPDEILDQYEKQADASKQSLESILTERLISSVNHTATKPLYLNDSQRQELERLVGRNLYRPKELLAAIGRLSLVRIENAQVHLDPMLLERLKTRHFSDLPFDAWLAQRVREWAEQYVGLR